MFQICGVLITFADSSAFAQSEWENPELDWLTEVMPSADYFSDKQGDPPVYFAYQSPSASAAEDVIGYVFTTPDLPPEEVGFSGPVDLLVGMDLQGRITGVKVLYYLESYKNFRGDFIAAAQYPEQFVGKSVEEGFQVGRDVDGMSRATISSWAMARGLRNAARRVAEAYIPELSYVAEATVAATALQVLQQQSWQELITSGLVTEFTVPIAGEADLQLAIAYMGHYRLGELLIGAADYSNADRAASSLVEDGHMILIGLDGNAARLQQLRLGVRQNGILYPNTKDRVVFAGSAAQGKIAGQAQFAVAMFLDSSIDITQAFSVVYDTSERSGAFEEFVGVDYELPATVLSLISGLAAQSGGRVVDAYPGGNPGNSDQRVLQRRSKSSVWGGFAFILLVLAITVVALRWNAGK